ncbi:MAG: phosphate ABC transporter permease subunit PstC [Anaerolineales bacterium]|nr:phosphate ABC transporter permease subunit PstC [Anaerolineales bacterium]
MSNFRSWLEKFIFWAIRISGYSAILFVIAIFLYLLREGLPAFSEVPLSNLLSERWYPNEDLFGLLPLLGGSLVVIIGATVIAVPIGICTAVYIAEVAPPWAREILKPIVEVLAGIPSVVLGFFGIVILAPYLRRALDLPTGLTALAGSLLLAATSLPTIVSVSEDALYSVPKSFRDASIALGVTEWQTIWHMTLPAARTGVLTACMLGIGRTVGETMAVLMVTGNAPVIPRGISSLFAPVRTMTATIAAEMGEVATGSAHYHVLFLIGITLFLITLAINLIAASVVFRKRQRAERILS